MKIDGFKFLPLPLLLLLLVCGSVTASADQIVNGTFAQTSPAYSYVYQPTNVSGWTFTGGAGVQQDGSAWGFKPAPGGQSAFLQNYSGSTSVPGPGGTLIPDSPATFPPTSTISQTLTGLHSGETYDLSFYLAQRPDYGIDPVTVSVGGTELVSGLLPPGSDAWTLYTESFIATSSSEDLSFSVDQSAAGDFDTGLGGVTVTPEPGTLMLLGTGLLGFAGMLRRKLRA